MLCAHHFSKGLRNTCWATTSQTSGNCMCLYFELYVSLLCLLWTVCVFTLFTLNCMYFYFVYFELYVSLLCLLWTVSVCVVYFELYESLLCLLWTACIFALFTLNCLCLYFVYFELYLCFVYFELYLYLVYFKLYVYFPVPLKNNARATPAKLRNGCL